MNLDERCSQIYELSTTFMWKVLLQCFLLHWGSWNLKVWPVAEYVGILQCCTILLLKKTSPFHAQCEPASRYYRPRSKETFGSGHQSATGIFFASHTYEKIWTEEERDALLHSRPSGSPMCWHSKISILWSCQNVEQTSLLRSSRRDG
jgi:hypothetical protein